MDSSDTPATAARLVIPRPPLHRAGAPAPWAALAADQRRGISLQRVRAALADESRRRTGRTREPWPTTVGTPGGRPAAVLVPLFEEDGETRVVLTVRSGRLRSHTGEVAFPGGRLDGDEGVVDAALREAEEEVGLDRSLVTVIGQLTPLPTVSSDTVMTPVVATLSRRPHLVANPGEVDRIFDVSVRELVADGAFTEEFWTVPDRVRVPGFPEGEFPVWFFDVVGETVWGATARTLMELICLVLGVPVPSSLRASPTDS